MRLLKIKDCLVTIDAMGCQKWIAQEIIDKEADYLLAVKANQKALLKQIESALLPKLAEQAKDGVLFNEAEYQRNREEFRCFAMSHDLKQLSETVHWKNAKTIDVIVSYIK